MKLLKNKSKTNMLSLILFGIIICGMFATTVSASPNYQLTLAKGTDDLLVNHYNDAAWKTTVNTSTNPSYWFEGDANITGAKSKTTILGWNDIVWQTWDVFTSLFLTKYISFEDLVIMNSVGYNETTINANYTDSYRLWYGVGAVWNFTAGAHLEQPSYNEGILVFKDPLDLKTILDDFNTIVAALNIIPSIMLMNYSFANVTSDDFLWQLALNGLAVAAPQTTYLTDLINELGCENASSRGRTLIFERSGETNYTVELSYGEEGTISSFTVKDVSESIIFQIISSNSEWIFFIILIILATCGAGLITYMIVKRRKSKK